MSMTPEQWRTIRALEAFCIDLEVLDSQLFDKWVSGGQLTNIERDTLLILSRKYQKQDNQ